MNKNNIITVLGIAAIIIAIGATREAAPLQEELAPNPTSPSSINNPEITNPQLPQEYEEGPLDPPALPVLSTTTFSGVVLDTDNSCIFDGECRVNVSGTWVTTNTGWYSGPRGSASMEQLKVGTRVEVYGQVTASGVTLLGDSSYYIKKK